MIDRNIPNEPTSDECNKHARVFETAAQFGHAIWYPQMGGYCGKGVAVFDKEWKVGKGGCIDVYVWHDGAFPFSEEDGLPHVIHHCDPNQFIEFGETLAKLNRTGQTDAED